jgi:hypothetical protein
MKCTEIFLLSTLLLSCGFSRYDGLSEQEKLALFEEQKKTVSQRLDQLTKNIPPELQALGDEIYAYNRGRSESLHLTKEAMSPGAPIIHQIYPVSGLKLDTRTIGLFETLLRFSDDPEIRGKIIWRFRKDYLDGKFKVPNEMRSYLKELVEAEIESERYGSNIHTAASILLEHIATGEFESRVQASHSVETEASESKVADGDQSLEIVQTQISDSVEKTALSADAAESPGNPSRIWPWMIGVAFLAGAIVYKFKGRD